MTTSGARAASGEKVSEERAKEESAKADEPIEVPDSDLDRKRRFRTPGFSRIRVNWNGPERRVVDMVTNGVNERLLATFPDAYEVMNSIYEAVRAPEVDANGEPVRDAWGLIQWKRNPYGGWDEDFTRMTAKQREHFLFVLTTRLFDWQQRAADLWGESMLAKAQWEEHYAISYDAPTRGTIEDRDARGKRESIEERYFAIYVSMLSRKADSLVRSMELLGQRLKDSLTA